MSEKTTTEQYGGLEEGYRVEIDGVVYTLRDGCILWGWRPSDGPSDAVFKCRPCGTVLARLDLRRDGEVECAGVAIGRIAGGVYTRYAEPRF